MAIDATVLKNSIIAKRDYYLTNYGKLNAKAAALQDVLIEMSATDILIVPATDLTCLGLEYA